MPDSARKSATRWDDTAHPVETGEEANEAATDVPATADAPDQETTAEEDLEQVFGEPGEAASAAADWDQFYRDIGEAGLTLEDVLGSSGPEFLALGGTLAVARTRFEKVKKG